MNNWMNKTLAGSVIAASLAMTPVMAQHDHGSHDRGARGHEAMLPMCPVMGEPVNLALSVPTDDGPVYFCCKGCIPKYQANPAKYAAKVTAQRKALADRAKVQVTCPVSKDPVDQKVFMESDGKKVHLCSKGCLGKYQRDPAKYASALANSYSYQTKCPVMGGDINPKVSTKLSTGETIYFCCPMCDKPLREDPAKYNKNLESQGILVNWADVEKADGGAHRGDDHDSHGHGDHDHGHGG